MKKLQKKTRGLLKTICFETVIRHNHTQSDHVVKMLVWTEKYSSNRKVLNTQVRIPTEICEFCFSIST